MDKAKISVLYDEGAREGTSFVGASGFSLLVEVDGEKTLFGTGRKERYLSNNLFVAGIDTDTISRVVISHGHSDHWGALPAVLKEREEKIQLFSSPSAWGIKKMFGSTGMCFAENVMERIEKTDVTGWIQLSEHLFITPPVKFHDGEGDEIFLVLVSKDGPILLSGCCHCGLDHAFEAVKDKFGKYPLSVIGGLHIGGRKDTLADVYSEYLKELGCRTLYLNHCTGVLGIGRMRTILGLNGIHDFYVGDSVEYSVF